MFNGFRRPHSNYSRLPHQFIEALPEFTSLAELKVVVYLLRHTWGYSEFGVPKRITVDEFMYGRKRSDETRIDNGTGLSENSVRNGLESAEAHGFIVVTVDDSDKARIKKSYSLAMSAGSSIDPDEDPQDLRSDPQDLHLRPSNLAPRTEKETKERKNKPSSKKPSTPSRSTLFIEALEKHFKIGVNPTFKAHREFLKWAIDEKNITPDEVEHAFGVWSSSGELTWNGKRSMSLPLFIELWPKLIASYNASQPDGDGGIDWES